MRLVLSSFLNPAPTFAAPALVTAPRVASTWTVGSGSNYTLGAYTGQPTPSYVSVQWFTSPTNNGSGPFTSVKGPQPPFPDGSYTPQVADAGAYLSVVETVQNADTAGTIHSLATRSNYSNPIVNPVSPPGAVSPPVISG